MRIALFGSTGETGQAVVLQALEKGHEVAAFSRRAIPVPTSLPGRLQVIVANAFKPELVDKTLANCDAVISALGSKHQWGPVSVCTDGVRAILAGMERQQVRRLVVVSAYGAAESRDRSLYSMILWATVGNKMRDKDSMEALIRASNVDWTIVRAPRLTDGLWTGHYRSGDQVNIGLTSRIDRADLADFLLSLAASDAFLHDTPKIAL